jgi:hypothetical protein
LLAIERDPPPALRVRLMALVEQDRREWERTRSAGAPAARVAVRGTGMMTQGAVVAPRGVVTGQQETENWWRRLMERTRRSPRLIYGMGSAVALVLIVLGVWLFNRNNVDTLHTYACAAPQPLVNGNDFSATSCTVQVRSDRSVTVAFNNLPTLSRAQAYELWMLTPAGHPVPVTGFEPGGSYDFSGIYHIDTSKYAKAAVTVEQAPGNSAMPHGPIVLVIPFDHPLKTQS